MNTSRALLVSAAMTLGTLSFSANAFVITGGKFGAPAFGTPGGLVTWSLAGPSPDCGDFTVADTLFVGPCSHLDSFMPVGYLAEIDRAFSAWSSVANIDFIQVPDGGDSIVTEDSGQIRISGHSFDGPGGTLAHAFFPADDGVGPFSDIHFDMDEIWKIGFGGIGFDIFQVLAHEIGHAIGLDHSTDISALMAPFYTEAFSGVQADDIAGARFIYGDRPIIHPVPEPGTLALMLAGLAVASSFRKKWIA